MRSKRARTKQFISCDLHQEVAMAGFAVFSTFLALAVLVCGQKADRIRSFHCLQSDNDFILDGSLAKVVRSAAGELRSIVGSSYENRPLWEHDVALGCVVMEPKALLLPQYMDAAAVFFVQQGEALVKWIRGADVASKNLRAGDVFSLPAGALFYVINTSDEELLKFVGMMDTSTAFRRGRAQRFFIGGGIEPNVVLSGFDTDTLAAAFKVSREEVVHFFGSQRQGPIIHTTVQPSGESTNKPSKEDSKKQKHRKDEDDKDRKRDDKKREQDDKKSDKEKSSPSINLYERPSFRNSYGWTASTFGGFSGNKRFEVFAAHLDAGSMLAPHWNPRGCDFGVVTKGSGTIQIAFSNGTTAVDEALDVGTVFHIPQFLPVCQIAAADSSLEIVGFTVVSSESSDEDVQFLAGEESVLRKLDLNILALSLNVPEQLVQSFLDSQHESVILPSALHSGLADY